MEEGQYRVDEAELEALGVVVDGLGNVIVSVLLGQIADAEVDLVQAHAADGPAQVPVGPDGFDDGRVDVLIPGVDSLLEGQLPRERPLELCPVLLDLHIEHRNFGLGEEASCRRQNQAFMHTFHIVIVPPKD